MLILKLGRNEQHLALNSTQPIRHGLCTTIGVTLIVGLSSCSPTASDPTGHTTPGAPSRQTASGTLSPQNRTLETHARATPKPILGPAPEYRTTDTQPQAPKSPDAAHLVPAETDPTAAARQQWLTEARVHPDATVRREALETWAAQPSQDLDPVTYALVDADDSVRTRAQELYEQQLAREAAVVQPTVPGNAEPPTRHAE